MIYDPEEDSFLLQKFVKKYAKGLVLDMGTGSGIQAVTASENADLVIGLDISKEVIKYCKKNVKAKNIQFFKSNLFEVFEDNFFFYDKFDNKILVYDKKKVNDREKLKTLVKKQVKFDVIVFNPPYLPQELQERDERLEGGKKGYEVIAKFLDKVSNYLKKDGKVLLLFSSFTNKGKIDLLIKKNNLRFVELEKKHIFFEDLYVYYIAKV
jgi:release factor glutamine methyltransferase